MNPEIKKIGERGHLSGGGPVSSFAFRGLPLLVATCYLGLGLANGAQLSPSVSQGAPRISHSPSETGAQSRAVEPLSELVARAGYSYTRVDESTWRIVGRGQYLQEIPVFVTESGGSIGVIVKIAERGHFASNPSVLNDLLARNSQFSRAKLSLSAEGDVLLTSSGALRLVDLTEFRTMLGEVLVAADQLARDLSSGSRLETGTVGGERTTPQAIGEPVEFEFSRALGPRVRGRGPKGRLVVQSGAIAFSADESHGVSNNFSVACGDVISMSVLPEPDRLHIEMKGQSYELYERRGSGRSAHAMALVAVACKKR